MLWLVVKCGLIKKIIDVGQCDQHKPRLELFLKGRQDESLLVSNETECHITGVDFAWTSR